MPSVKTSYYFPKAVTNIAVTQTFSCPIQTASASHDNNELTTSAAVTLTTNYVADYDSPSGAIDYGLAGGVFGVLSDEDIAVARTDDGRLSAINASSAGESGTVLQDAVTVASVAALAMGAARVEGGAMQPCQIVAENFSGDATKTAPSIALTYSLNIGYILDKSQKEGVPDKVSMIEADDEDNVEMPTPSRGTTLTIPIAPASRAMSSALQNKTDGAGLPSGLFGFDIKLSKITPLKLDAKWTEQPSRIHAKLNRVDVVALTIRGPEQTGVGEHPKFNTADVYTSSTEVPIKSYYDVPLPDGEWFGKETFALSLTNAGAISKIEYGTTTGTTDMANVASAAAKAVKAPQTTADEAANVQSQADLIYEQQRLIVCQQTPTQCQSK